MRVLMVHWAWTLVGGAERRLFLTRDLLRQAGHEVRLFGTAHPNSVALPDADIFPPYRELGRVKFDGEALHAAAEMLYSRPARAAMRAMLDRFTPDVAFVNTWEHRLSYSVLAELRGRGVPMVQFFSAYSPVCPNWSLLRDGKYCEACLSGSFRHAIGGRCVKDSRAASAIAAAEAYLNRFVGAYEMFDRFIANSDVSREILVRGGLPADRVHVLENCVDLEAWQPAPGPPAEEPYVAAVSRLYPNKGVDVLVRAAALVPHVGVAIAGEGTERSRLESLAADVGASNVRFLGMIDGQELRDLVYGSRAVIMPSVWPETFGNTITEAFAMARPVIGSDVGNIPALVREGETGCLVPVGDASALAEAIRRLCADPELTVRLGRAAREYVEREHSPADYYRRLLEILEMTRASASRTS